MAIGLLCIYAVLVLLFHKFIQPVTILAALPPSVGGALVALLIVRLRARDPFADRPADADGHRHEELDPARRVRVMARRDHGMSRMDALIDSCSKRARPIVMTTIAMIAGMLPVAVGWSADPSFRSPMGVAVIGGLIISTALSLFIVPAMYTVVDDFQQWLGAKLQARRRRHGGRRRAGALRGVGSQKSSDCPQAITPAVMATRIRSAEQNSQCIEAGTHEDKVATYIPRFTPPSKGGLRGAQGAGLPVSTNRLRRSTCSSSTPFTGSAEGRSPCRVVAADHVRHDQPGAGRRVCLIGGGEVERQHPVRSELLQRPQRPVQHAPPSPCPSIPGTRGERSRRPSASRRSSRRARSGGSGSRPCRCRCGRPTTISRPRRTSRRRRPAQRPPGSSIRTMKPAAAPDTTAAAGAATGASEKQPQLDSHRSAFPHHSPALVATG